MLNCSGVLTSSPTRQVILMSLEAGPRFELGVPETEVSVTPGFSRLCDFVVAETKAIDLMLRVKANDMNPRTFMLKL